MGYVLTAGLIIITWGVYLKLLYHSLTTKKSVNQMRNWGIISFAGVFLMAIGIWLHGQSPQDGANITSVGASVAALGGTSIIEALGRRRGQEKTIRKGARLLLGIGSGIIVIGAIFWLIMTYC